MTTHGVPGVGTAWREQHISELDAAYEMDRGRRRLTVPKNTALDEVGRLRGLLVKFRAAIERKVKRENGLGKVWEPTIDDCKAVQAVTAAYEKAVATEERLRKMLKEERAGYTDEEHAIALNRALKMAAAEWPAKDWWDALRIGWGDEVARKLVILRWGEDVLAGLEGS